MKKSVIWMSASALASTISQLSWGFGLGELSMRSFLNEPLSAEVALFDTQALSAEDIRIGLASEVEFDRLGIQRAYFLTSIRFDIQSGSDGLYIELSTEAPLREPYLDFVLEARWPDGRLLREYTVLVDLPMRANKASAATTGELARSEVREASESPTTAAREYDRTADSVAAAGGDYLVAGSDTLWRIASQAAPPGASVDQTMIEIVARNPEAFTGQNINGLKAGYVLTLPTAEQISISDEAAEIEVSRQNEAWQSGALPESGLKLVADNELAEMSVAKEANAEPEVDLPAEVAAGDEVDPIVAALESERQALDTMVSDLQATVVSLESALTERDRELEALRAESAEQVRSLQVALAQVADNQAAARRASEALPLWVWIAGLLSLLSGGLALLWVRRKKGDEEVELVSRGATRADQSIFEDGALEASDEDEDSLSPVQRAVEEANIYVAYGRVDQAIEVLLDAMDAGDASPALRLRLLECYIEDGQDAAAAALNETIAETADMSTAERARELMQAAGLVESAVSAVGDTDQGFLSDEDDSVLSPFSFSTDPSFDDPTQKSEAEASSAEARAQTESVSEYSAADNDGSDWEDEVAGEQEIQDLEGEELESLETDTLYNSALDEPVDSGFASASSQASLGVDMPASLMADDRVEVPAGLSLAPQDDTEDSGAPDRGLAPQRLEAATKTSSGLSLAPIDREGELVVAEAAEVDQGNPAEPGVDDESIHGTETNPVDSKLDLARAYIDMGDEDGARPVLQEVIREGDLSQQAEARELLLRIEAS